MKSNNPNVINIVIPSRSPHGERGLKFVMYESVKTYERRSPHGERGLKSAPLSPHEHEALVALLTESVD